jgi:hypothetical protein
MKNSVTSQWLSGVGKGFLKKRNSILLAIIFWITVSIILTVFLVRDLIGNSGFIYSRALVRLKICRFLIVI